jgi:hypothetical protein
MVGTTAVTETPGTEATEATEGMAATAAAGMDAAAVTVVAVVVEAAAAEEDNVKIYARYVPESGEERPEEVLFYPAPSDGATEVEVMEEQIDRWLEYELDEYVDEEEELPRVKADPMTEEWDKEFEFNVREAARRLKKKGLMPKIVCEYLNDLGYRDDEFWLETLQKLRPAT